MTKDDNSEDIPDASPLIQSLAEYEVPLTEEIAEYLKNMYFAHYRTVMETDASAREDRAQTAAEKHVDLFRRRMKRSPAQSVLRVSSHESSRSEIAQNLEHFISDWIESRTKRNDRTKELCSILPAINLHDILNDVIVVDFRTETTRPVEGLFASSTPHPDTSDLGTFSTSDQSSRQRQGWPVQHKVAIVDRFCGEAVLRGADVFVKGILVADAGIRSGETVAVYAHVNDNKKKNPKPSSVTRGMLLPAYTGHCVFLGLGQSCCERAAYFSQSSGLGIKMSVLPFETARPILPPLNQMPDLKLYPQNLPSVVVAHALNPQPEDAIYDMCGAPGGKTSHLATLTNGGACVVMSDKSRMKVKAAAKFFDQLGYSDSIIPLHIDATKCVERGSRVNEDTPQSVREIISNATRNEKDGLLEIRSFPAGIWDKILLDPPCSALGLRPKLAIPQTRARDLASYADYQKRFIREAVDLLRSDGHGVMTYSTCSINALENEANVKWVMDTFPSMELVPIEIECGSPGLAGYGLTKSQRECVRRFDSFIDADPADDDDHMGFFIAKFRKRKSG